MKRLILFYFLIEIIGGNLFAQSARKGFKDLSRPEKHWVMVHPFIAKKAFHCIERARFVTDSLQKNKMLLYSINIPKKYFEDEALFQPFFSKMVLCHQILLPLKYLLHILFLNL